jgi:outer membrane biosynthesis protein TonB
MSPRQVNALVDKTEPIQTPCCGHGLHIEGTIVLAISVDADGEVTCVTIVSGHPLIIGSAIDSVRRWKFRSYVVNGLKKSFCGKVTLRYKATDAEVKYDVVQGT